MTEAYLHYLFNNRKLGSSFVTKNGESMEIVDFGELNTNSGPDFLQSKIRFDGKTWAGNIEFHLNSSDWYKHGHQGDIAYNNVIAHFVLNHDKEVLINRFQLPVVELKELIDPSGFGKYEEIQKAKGWIPCEKLIGDVAESSVKNQLSKSIYERLNRKSIEVLEILETNEGNQKKTFFQMLGKAFGTKVNQDAFLCLTEKLDFEYVQLRRDNPVNIQAYCHGVSGFLDENLNNYQNKLCSIYQASEQAIINKQMSLTEWKFSSMRPFNSPTIRIAQFAALLCKKLDIERITEMSFADWFNYFEIELDEFWATHYNFKNECRTKSYLLSNPFKNQLIINAIVPFYFAIGRLSGDVTLKGKAIDFLKSLPTEKNSITLKWSRLGVKSTTAFESQALIELKNEQCNRKKCLFCTIGKEIINK